MGYFELAVRDFSEAIRLNPQLALAYYGRSLTYTMMGDDVAAGHDVNRAAALGFDLALLNSEIGILRQRFSALPVETLSRQEKSGPWTNFANRGLPYLLVALRGRRLLS